MLIGEAAAASQETHTHTHSCAVDPCTVHSISGCNVHRTVAVEVKRKF